MNDIIMMPIKEVHPYPNNPRVNKDAVDKVAASLRAFGFRQPIVVDKDYVIICGHTRLEAAKRLRMKEVPVLVADDLSEEQVRAYRLADNKTAEFSEWDLDKLVDEIAEIMDIDMEEFGFDLSEFVEEPQVVEDDFEPEIPEEPKAKPGDIYLLGRHRLMCGDATCIDDVRRLTMDKPVDMVLTDPPYGVDYEKKEKNLEQYRANQRVETDALTGIKDDDVEDDKLEQTLYDAFINLSMCMKKGAAFHIWHSEWKTAIFRRAIEKARLHTRQQLIWVKNNISIGRQDFQRMYEVVLTGDNLFAEDMEEAGYEPCEYGWKDGAKHTWYKKRKEKDVMFFDKPVASRSHPTMKPIKLFDYEMQCNTKQGDVVLDLFAGSGTTIMAAEQNGRTAYCMELDPKYVDVIIDRWESFTGEKAVLLKGGVSDGKDGKAADSD